MSTPLKPWSDVAHTTGATYADMEDYWENQNTVLAELIAAGGAVWGNISGNLADQDDLYDELTGLQNQIDAITAKSDVSDIVATYAELTAYDKPLYVGDIIKVLSDSAPHAGEHSYYRCTGGTAGAYTWSYIGSESAYYSKSESDSMISGVKTATDFNAGEKFYSGSSGTINLANGLNQKCSASSITLPTAPSGSVHKTLLLYVTASTVSWGGTIVWEDGVAPTLSSGVDCICFTGCEGKWRGSYAGSYSS